MSVLAIAAAIVIAVTAMIHSVAGEQRMIRPLLASGSFSTMPRVGRAMRFTWHMSSLLMVLTAFTIAWPGTPTPLVLLIGAAYLARAKRRHES